MHYPIELDYVVCRQGLIGRDNLTVADATVANGDYPLIWRSPDYLCHEYIQTAADRRRDSDHRA